MIEKLAAVQMSIVEGEVARNLDRAAQLIRAASGADLYLLPELFTSGYAFDAWPAIARDEFSTTVEWMQSVARETKAFLAGSIIALNDEGRLANRFLLFDREGREVLRYDKAHLFSALREDEHLAPGGPPQVVELEGLRVAPAICYDLRFPEMFRRAALQTAATPRCAVRRARLGRRGRERRHRGPGSHAAREVAAVVARVRGPAIGRRLRLKPESGLQSAAAGLQSRCGLDRAG
ncbi:MAG: nitrilase-related carbon-nitrogen hydrolase [Thermoanaerobaculia bacterium]